MTDEPWPRLGDDPSLIGPPDWLLWDDAFRRLCKRRFTTSEDARDILRDLVRRGRSAFVQVNSNAEETDVRFFPGTISGPVDADQVEPRVVMDAHGVEHIVPHQIYRPPIGSGFPDYLDGHTEFWVLVADIENEERPYEVKPIVSYLSERSDRSSAQLTYLTPAAPPKSPATPRKPRSTPRLNQAKEAVRALWPDDVPTHLENKVILKDVGKWFKDNRRLKPSDTVILRAAGRKK